MLKDITLGQYFPGNTIVHRLDPRTKLIAVVLYIAALFTANNWSATALVLLTLVFCVALSRIRPKALFKGLKPLIGGAQSLLLGRQCDLLVLGAAHHR